ncbi:MAG: sensor histidine kinase [Pyrinomonadaceae bacterium]
MFWLKARVLSFDEYKTRGITLALVSGEMRISLSQIHTRGFVVIELNRMLPLKLHIKTSLLASLITVLMFVVALTFVSIRIASLIQEKEKDLARTQATSFAEHIENLSSRDNDSLQEATNLIDSTQPSVSAVRVWKADTNNFSELVASDDSADVQAISVENESVLRSGKPTEAIFQNRRKETFRAFAPITDKNGTVFGAVEIAQDLDRPWTIAAGYAQSEIWVALVTVLLIMAATYLLFRYLVYRPLKLLLDAMAQAETGNLSIQAPVFAEDELGQVASKFNRMVSSLDEVTKEREAYQETLQTRITEATGELQNKNEQLSDANRELWRVSKHLSEVERLAAAGQTAAQFAHEVGTPLNLISGHVQLLRLKSKDENDTRLQIISEQIERIERIVRGMLDRTKITKGEKNLLDLNEVLRRTFEATAPLLDERKINLTENLEENLPLILGDGDHLQQLFINLINNALDAMTATDGELKIETRRAGNSVVIDFADNGTGMSETVLARIFDVLYTTKGTRGTGLGLVVVKQIIQEHDGAIEVESKAGQGTRFRLHFPVSR